MKFIQLYGFALGLYPKSFQKRYRQELLQTFEAGLQHAKTDRRLGLFYGQTIVDFSVSLVKTHLEYDSAAFMQKLLLTIASGVLALIFAIQSIVSFIVPQLEKNMTFPVTIFNNQPPTELALWWWFTQLSSFSMNFFLITCGMMLGGSSIALLRLKNYFPLKSGWLVSTPFRLILGMVVAFLAALAIPYLAPVFGFILSVLWVLLTVVFWKYTKPLEHQLAK